jgi:hypothetical protein
MNRNTPFELVVGDTYKPLGRTLYDGRLPADLTGLTVQFKMVDKNGTVVVDWAAATVVSASAGTVKYVFQDADVDTAGKFYGYFRTVSSGDYATYPADHYGIPITIHALATDEHY